MGTRHPTWVLKTRPIEKRTKNSVSANLSEIARHLKIRCLALFEIRPCFLLFLMRKTLFKGQKWLSVLKVLLDFRFGHWKCFMLCTPNVGNFCEKKRKFKTIMWEQIEKFRNFSGILNFLFYEGKFFGN